MRDTGGRVTLAIHALPKPVIAAINGAAVGIGATMTLGMDIRMASTEARIGFVFGRIGITPEAASSWFLPRIVGPPAGPGVGLRRRHPHRRRRPWPAGCSARCTPPDELLPAAQELARSFVRDRSPVALGLAKQLLYRHAGSAEPLEAHLSDSLAIFWASLADGKEGVAAFLEKRPPEFTGKASELPRID